jgi:ATP-binding cassette subfamily G (WHITE) protein 2 (PDR)
MKDTISDQVGLGSKIHPTIQATTPSPSSTPSSTTNRQSDNEDSTYDEKYIGERSLFNTQQHRESEVRDLARVLTAASIYSESDVQNVFTPKSGSSFDPHSSNFNARAWTKAVIALQCRDPQKYPRRTSGLAFRDLNVHGYGNPTDYQKSVGNVWLELPSLIGKLCRSNGRRKIDILQGCDGLVESGEMLVVLGPPGSGCSTLLKMIAGETHGIYVDECSYLNYKGR